MPDPRTEGRATLSFLTFFPTPWFFLNFLKKILNSRTCTPLCRILCSTNLSYSDFLYIYRTGRPESSHPGGELRSPRNSTIRQTESLNHRQTTPITTKSYQNDPQSILDHPNNTYQKDKNTTQKRFFNAQIAPSKLHPNVFSLDLPSKSTPKMTQNTSNRPQNRAPTSLSKSRTAPRHDDFFRRK